MNRLSLLLLICFLFQICPAHAVQKYFQGHLFEASVITHYSGSEFEERPIEGTSLIQVREGDEYSILVRNPLPVRVAATVTVDGLNTIDGQRTTPEGGQKWIIEPESSITIRGWQTNDSNLRRFIFTREGASYAKWKERRDRKNYTANLGVIGVSYFWNSAELSDRLSPARPFLENEKQEELALGSSPGSVGSDEAAKRSRRQENKGRAGTGMGFRQWNPVTRINFYYDTGMFSPSDVLAIRYEFAEAIPRPRPFEEPQVRYRYPGNYAPEMP